MSTIAFDAAAFRAQFPGQFPDPPYTDAVLNVYWDIAVCYVSTDTYGSLSAECRRQAINLMVAHLITLSDPDATASGGTVGLVESATIDKISVKVQTFQATGQFSWFLNQTIYGQQLYAMLFLSTAGGSYQGGFNELGSFRRAGGAFIPPASGVSATASTALSCVLLTAPPAAPYTTDFGVLVGVDAIENPVDIVAPCSVMSAEITADLPSADFELRVWSGSDIDSGSRFNVYLWDAAAVTAGGVPTFSATAVDVTGFTKADGFAALGLVLGAALAVNLVVVTGADNAIAQMLNMEMSTV